MSSYYHTIKSSYLKTAILYLQCSYPIVHPNFQLIFQGLLISREATLSDDLVNPSLLPSRGPGREPKRWTQNFQTVDPHRGLTPWTHTLDPCHGPTPWTQGVDPQRGKTSGTQAVDPRCGPTPRIQARGPHCGPPHVELSHGLTPQTHTMDPSRGRGRCTQLCSQTRNSYQELNKNSEQNICWSAFQQTFLHRLWATPNSARNYPKCQSEQRFEASVNL